MLPWRATPATGPAVSKSTAAATAPPPSAASPLRDLAARYLDSDGQGGWRTNEQAATELEKLGPQEAAALWPLLKDPQVDVRRGAAVYLLSQFDPANSEQVAAFTALLGDSDRMVRTRALDAAKQFSKEDQIASLPRLAAMLDPARGASRKSGRRSSGCADALKKDAATALPELESAAAGDPDARVRAAALVAISQIAEPPQAVPLLAKGLADKEASVRLVAAARLRQLGPAAAGAANELAAALRRLRRGCRRGGRGSSGPDWRSRGRAGGWPAFFKQHAGPAIGARLSVENRPSRSSGGGEIRKAQARPRSTGAATGRTGISATNGQTAEPITSIKTPRGSAPARGKRISMSGAESLRLASFGFRPHRCRVHEPSIPAERPGAGKRPCGRRPDDRRRESRLESGHGSIRDLLRGFG